jgi:transposase
MRRAKQFTQPKALIKSLHGSSPSERLLHRLHSIALVLSGLSASEAARLYGDSPRAVAYWVTRYKQRGLEGLQEESRPGRPSRLNPSQTEKLRGFLKQSRKRSQKVTANVLSKYIKQTFGVTLTIRQCWRILKRLAG